MSDRPSIPTRALGRGGLRVGPNSFGVAPIANLGRKIEEETAMDALEAAWRSGVRYFDVAPHYGLGLGERRLGQFLSTKPRDEYIVSTKVGRLLVENPNGVQVDTEGFQVRSALVRRRDYTEVGVRRSLDDSLMRLGLDRIDIVFVHDPDDYRDEALGQAFPALDTLRREGVITSYGAGMNQSAMLADFVANTDLDVVMCAGRYTLLDQTASDHLLPLAESRGVSVVSAAAFNSGLLARERPPADVTYDYAPAEGTVLARANAIADVCDSHGVPLPAAALQFALGNRAIATVCTGARSAEQVTRNAALFDFPIPAAFWHDLVSAGLLSAHLQIPSGQIQPER